MSEAREDDNAAAAAMREIQALRGTNTTLRAVEGASVPPPLTDEEAAAEFAASTGLIIDPATGGVIGKMDAKSLEQLRKEREESERMEAGVEAPTDGAARLSQHRIQQGKAAANTVAEMGPLMNGVDLDERIVVMDGEEFPMDDAHYKGVVVFMNEVVAIAMNERLQARLTAAGIKVTREAPKDDKPTPTLPPVRGRKARKRLRHQQG